MLCDFKVIKKEDLITSTWSGGTTTQLSIFPENSSYKERNFIWRLSSATVEEETSEFTHLPDYNRILMILDGKIALNHNDKEIVNLNTFDQNEFDGGNTTISIGKVVDFNLMMKKDSCSGNVKAIDVKRGTVISHKEINGFYKFEHFTLALYCFKACINISVEKDINARLNKGDLLLINFSEPVSSIDIILENSAEEDGKLIFTQIFY